MKKILLFLSLSLFVNFSSYAQPQLDATVSFELNPLTSDYRLKIVINEDINFKFTENYTSTTFVMIIKDLYTSTPNGGASGGENSLSYISTNASNLTGNSNGLGTYGATYGPFVYPNDEQIGFAMTGTFNTDDIVSIKAGTIIQDPGNFSSVPTINPGPYTVVIGNQSFTGIAATTTTEQVLGVDKNTLSNKINFYPNPTSSILNVDSKVLLDKIEIYNLVGAKVMIKQNDLSKIDISNFKSGIYLLKLSTEKNSLTKKLIIK